MEQIQVSQQQTIDIFKSNLLKDQVSFQRAYNDFVNFVPLFVNQSNHGDHKSRNEDLKIKFIGSNSVQPVARKFNEDNTRELMLVTELSRKNTLGDVMRSPTPPKYGLPGLGEYDERRKTYLRERKKDYINYLNEQNAKPKRRPNANERLLDYEGLLAQKRREEYDYRQLISDPYMINGGIKPAKSDSNVSKIENWNNPGFTVDQNYDHGFPRPHSYPPEFNLGVFSNAEYERDGSTDGLQDSGKRPTTNIHLFSYKTDPNSRRQPLNDFSPGRWKPEEEKRAEYQADLKKQMEEAQQRRAKMKEDEEKLNKRLEEENRSYDPWGRDGGGAPRRDRYGKVIASRCQIDNYKRDQILNENAKVTAEKFNSRHPSKTDESEANYAIPRSPPMSRSPPVIRDERRVESYKDELKRQIEEKKLKQQLEKESERLEDEKLARRIQEQQDKMQREYEEEQKKHRIREDERRRRNEDLQRRQDEQKKETNRRRREVLDEERRNHWEAREKSLGRNQSNSDQHLEKSPPLPSIKTKQSSVYSEESGRDSKGSIGLSSQQQTQKSASRKHILTQLSTMRQQLEREQQQIQEQLKKQKEGSYENYNQPSQNGRHEDQISDNILEEHNGHERWIERNDVREPTNKTSLNSPRIYRPATGQLISEESEPKMPPVPEEVTRRERRIAPKVNTVRKMLPATALSLRSLDGFTPLQGESLFLGVDGYDLAPTNRWRQQNRRSSKTSELNGMPQTDHYDGDRLADQEAARRRYLHAFNDDPDEVNADSFLDEYLARNIRK